MTIFLSWGRRDGDSRLGWWGSKETDMFLVVSEPCQEAQQVQDPSAPLHSPNRGPIGSTRTLPTSPQGGVEQPLPSIWNPRHHLNIQEDQKLHKASKMLPGLLWRSPARGYHLLVEVTHLWTSPACSASSHGSWGRRWLLGQTLATHPGGLEHFCCPL